MKSPAESPNILYEWSVTFFRRSLAEFNRFVRNSGLSMPQIVVLTRLYHRGPCEITQLKDLLKTSKAGAGQLVDRMEQQGLVLRSVSKADRRARLVALTDKGNELVKASIDARESWMTAIMEQVPAEETETVYRVLNTLTQIAISLDKERGGEGEISFTDPHMI
jgi:DNA-binding MarR family transcriptional regulator